MYATTQLVTLTASYQPVSMHTPFLTNFNPQSKEIQLAIFVTARFAIWPILKRAAHFTMGQPILKPVSPINKYI